MRKQLFLTLGIALTAAGCSSDSFSETQFDSVIEESFVTTLTNEEEKVMIQVFNETEGDFHTEYQASIGTLDDVNYSISYVHGNRNILAANEVGTVNYTLYESTSEQISKLGTLNEPVGKLASTEEEIYVITYKDSKPVLKKYASDDLSEPIETWDLNGEVDDMKVNLNNGEVLVWNRTESGTFLKTIQGDQMDEQKLFDQQVSGSIVFSQDEVLIAKEEEVKLEGKDQAKQGYNVIYKLTEDGLKEFVATRETPRKMVINDGKLFTVTGSPNQPYVEIYDMETQELMREPYTVEGGLVSGMTKANETTYLYTNKVVYDVSESEMKVVHRMDYNPRLDTVIEHG
ncbi:hypothetical protein N781_08990 [Pontibacillus halophilus JSM 076056 = DSM 19796]|uniref:Lipoprotein n=1 Tax=Pontibacillus halophilus JSM 076056 = DSM 19796 TaxID=1385510 RepID=A0A0A5GF53_9BACI|nr:hypothetical protein [Pontibacillus halophilus]KGX89843.1 hypothetical protein N781_08990 [Pontibacillus halophilus JSM 076056 = DSM 19796]